MGSAAKRDEAEEKRLVSGPAVKKLLSERLEIQETLRVNPHEETLSLYSGGAYSTARQSWPLFIWEHNGKQYRRAYAAPKGARPRERTVAELVAEVDAYLKERREKSAEYRRARETKENEARVHAQIRLVMLAEMDLIRPGVPVPDHVKVEIAPGLTLKLEPNPETRRWRAAWGSEGEGLTSEALRALLPKVKP